MLRLLLGLCLLAAGWTADATPPTAPATPSAAPTEAEIDRMVDTYNPNVWTLGADRKVLHRIEDAFAEPASDVARTVSESFWFSLLVFSPFLVLPQVLLIYIIFKFRDRRDGRTAARFTHNVGLEVVWTLIPCVALVIVTIPAIKHVTWMEYPPDERRVDVVPVEVVGKQFSWKYRYMKEAGTPQFSLDAAGLQEPLVLPTGRTVVLNITSEDVNHAWWVPAFGVKKDAIIGRFTSVWFTPDRVGTFKGQCAELCGNDHGRMVISSVVVDQAAFAVWLDLLRHRDDAGSVWTRLRGKPEEVEAAVAKYFEHDRSPARALALRYWTASNYASAARGIGASKDATAAAGLAAETLRNRTRIGELAAAAAAKPL